MAQDSSIARDARTLYAANQQGILSTMSRSVPGYPFGSVITFAPDHMNRPVILISDLAEHTKNIAGDSRVSITMIEGGDDIQASGRLTLIGDAAELPDNEETAELAQRFYRRFPQAIDYHKAHDFRFFRIEPVRLRYIGGFGKIHWVKQDDICVANPFDAKTEAGMIDHMNADHLDAMRDYCRLYGVDPGDQAPRMSAIDGEGFDLMIGKRLLRIPFDQALRTATEVRQAMVALVKRARAPEAVAG